LVEDPTNADGLALAATYGILTTADRGRNWFHICEASFADLASYTGDPLLDFTNDGALLVGVQATINASRDGCHWKKTIGGGNTFVVDHTLIRSAPATVVALLANYRNGTVDYALWKSTDGAENWSELGAVPVESAYTLDVDGADENHIYVTGVADDVGQLLRSNDGGRTWTVRPIPNTNFSEAPYLAALHPGDARRLYVRTDSWVPIGGDLAAHDALLYSSDGGDTWTEVFRNRAKLLGFALSPDGETVLLGYGDSFAGGTTSVTGPLGVFRSRTDAFAFEPILSAHVSCLAWTARGVYVCASQHFDKFELGFSPRPDFDSDAGGITPLLRLPEVKGPLMCPSGTAGAACCPNWIAACAVFSACDDAGTSTGGCAGRDGGTPDSGSGADVGNGADVGTAGTGGSPHGQEGSRGGDCDCRAGGRKANAGGAALALLAVAGLERRRRSRR
jgi:MYXO-CTERM domain-containing protein